MYIGSNQSLGITHLSTSKSWLLSTMATTLNCSTKSWLQMNWFPLWAACHRTALRSYGHWHAYRNLRESDRQDTYSGKNCRGYGLPRKAYITRRASNYETIRTPILKPFGLWVILNPKPHTSFLIPHSPIHSQPRQVRGPGVINIFTQLLLPSSAFHSSNWSLKQENNEELKTEHQN